MIPSRKGRCPLWACLSGREDGVRRGRESRWHSRRSGGGWFLCSLPYIRMVDRLNHPVLAVREGTGQAEWVVAATLTQHTEREG